MRTYRQQQGTGRTLQTMPKQTNERVSMPTSSGGQDTHCEDGPEGEHELSDV